MLNDGTCSTEVCISERNALIGIVRLFFEGIQLRIIKDLPPFTANHIVLRLREFPVVGLLEILRGDFLVTRRTGHSRLFVFWRLVAALE